MFPTNHENPFPYPYDHPQNPQNPSSRHHDLDHQPPPFLLHDDSPLSQVFSQPPPPHAAAAAAGDHKAKKGGGGPSRKRNPGKKDRHSKICTARGVRDRRMRLSLQIARKFFDLQDMLGFDKASKTIEWLFSKSKNAIKDLMRTKNIKSAGFVSSSDEYEVGSITPATKESRQEARARARERTMEKKKKMMIRGLENSSPSSLDQLGSSSNSPFLEESCCQEIKSNNTCPDLAQSFSKQYLGDEEIRSNNACTDLAQWFSRQYLGEEEIMSNNATTDLAQWSGKQYLEEAEIRSNNTYTDLAQSFSRQQYLRKEEIKSNNTCTDLAQWFGKLYSGEEEIRSNNAPLGFENQFASSVGIKENFHQDNGETFMGFLGNWDLAGAGAGAGAGTGAGISPYTHGLDPFPGINPSTTLYFGATSLPLDQERQFSCNHYSLG